MSPDQRVMRKEPCNKRLGLFIDTANIHSIKIMARERYTCEYLKDTSINELVSWFSQCRWTLVGADRAASWKIVFISWLLHKLQANSSQSMTETQLCSIWFHMWPVASNSGFCISDSELIYFVGGCYETQLTLAKLLDGCYSISVRYYIMGWN